MAEMKVSPQEEMASPQGMKVFAVERPRLPEDFVSFPALCGVQSSPLVFAPNLPFVRGPLQWYVCMYVCMVITYSRVWINRVRLPILLVVS